jgi:hypothetical protein
MDEASDALEWIATATDAEIAEAMLRETEEAEHSTAIRAEPDPAFLAAAEETSRKGRDR